MTTIIAGGPQSYAASGFATAIIDGQMAIVSETIEELGEGPPTTGEGYQAAAQQLDVIAGDMTTAVGVAAWESPAGELFSMQFQALARAVAQIAKTDQSLALTMDQQAAAVATARAELHSTERKLFIARTHALAWANSGNMIKSQSLQTAAVQLAQTEYRAAMAKLTSATATSTTQATGCHTSMDEIEESLASDAISPQSLASTSGVVNVAPGDLTRMATAVQNCSSPLVVTIGIGPQIFKEVQLTHGHSAQNAAFLDALAFFVERHIAVLKTINKLVVSHAKNLNRTGELYVECDDSDADDLQFDLEEDFTRRNGVP